MKNTRLIIIGLMAAGMSFGFTVAKESSKDKYDRACAIISKIAKEKNACKKELMELKKRLSEVLPMSDGDFHAKIDEMEQVRERINQLSSEEGDEAITLLSKIESVAQDLKEHELNLDFLTTIIPEKIKITDATGDSKKDLQQRLQALVKGYNEITDNATKLRRQISAKNKALTDARKDRDEAVHYLIEVANYAGNLAK